MKTIAMLVAVLVMSGCTAQVGGPPEPGATEHDAVTGDGGDAGDTPCPAGEHACPLGPQGWACIDGDYYCALASVACVPPKTPNCVPWNGYHGDASNLPGY